MLRSEPNTRGGSKQAEVKVDGSMDAAWLRACADSLLCPICLGALPAGEGAEWRPFLGLVSDLAGYGQRTSGVLADHLRLTDFWCHPELERCPVTPGEATMISKQHARAAVPREGL